MKAVFINHSDSLGGASVVTRRLVEALREHTDVDATMLVTDIRRPAPFIVPAASRLRARVPFMMEHLRIYRANGHSRNTLFKISIATDGLPLHRHPAVREADVVVLNWVNQGMLSLDEIARIARKKPVVWTMHDMWNVTAVCHHAGLCRGYLTDCARCPLLPPRSGLSAATFARKRTLYDRAGIHFVAVSDWLARCAARSALLRDRPLSVIPNICTVTPPSDLILPTGRPLVTMCAARLDDPVKGLDRAIAALNLIPDITFVTIGEIKNPEAVAGLRIPHIHLGTLDATDRQAVFAQSAVVLSTSHYESFGATLVEAQAAGATPVAYTHDGRADIITDGVNGYVLPPEPDPTADHPMAILESIEQGHCKAVADTILRAIRRPAAPDALADAAARFSPQNIARRYRYLLARLMRGE